MSGPPLGNGGKPKQGFFGYLSLHGSRSLRCFCHLIERILRF
jgi:hypothetical protein